MKEFYVQVMSNASTAEFPSNQANSFKNRLPNPLELREPGWKVGVSDLSLPSAIRKMNLKNPFLCRIIWIECFDPKNRIYAHSWIEISERDLEFTPRTGKELMNMIRDVYHWWLMDHTIPDLQLFKKKNDSHDPTELLYMVMHRAENGQCVIDNTQTCTTIQINGKLDYAKLSISLELAKKMKWIKMATLDDSSAGYILGPNLRKEFPTNVVPTATDLIIPRNDGDEIFYKIDADALHLSSFINWVFMDLDRSYEQAFGCNCRPLHVYSNVGHSMVTGNQVTDLMKQVPYSPEDRDFQPKHILYLPVRTIGMDIFEVQVAENDGTLVEFSSGVTSITLHFKHERFLLDLVESQQSERVSRQRVQSFQDPVTTTHTTGRTGMESGVVGHHVAGPYESTTPIDERKKCHALLVLGGTESWSVARKGGIPQLLRAP